MSMETAAERFARFKSRPDVADVTHRYGDWAVSSEGMQINMQLALYAHLRAGEQMSRPAYRRAVRDLAAKTAIPIRDFLIIAQCGLELVRSGIASTSQVSFTPSEWDAETEDE